MSTSLSLRFRYSEMNIREKSKKIVSIIATSSYDTFLLYRNKKRFHESLDNLTPKDVYLGQGEKIKKIRETIKQNSINKRISENKRMKLQRK